MVLGTGGVLWLVLRGSLLHGQHNVQQYLAASISVANVLVLGARNTWWLRYTWLVHLQPRRLVQHRGGQLPTSFSFATISVGRRLLIVFNS